MSEGIPEYGDERCIQGPLVEVMGPERPAVGTIYIDVVPRVQAGALEELLKDQLDALVGRVSVIASEFERVSSRVEELATLALSAQGKAEMLGGEMAVLKGRVDTLSQQKNPHDPFFAGPFYGKGVR